MPLLLDELLEGTARHIFHDNIMIVARHTNIIDVDDIRMREARGRLRFPMKLLDEFLIAFELRMQNLHGDRTIEQLVMRFIDIRHPAAADQLLKFIALIKNTVRHFTSPPFIPC